MERGGEDREERGPLDVGEDVAGTGLVGAEGGKVLALGDGEHDLVADETDGVDAGATDRLDHLGKRVAHPKVPCQQEDFSGDFERGAVGERDPDDPRPVTRFLAHLGRSAPFRDVLPQGRDGGNDA